MNSFASLENLLPSPLCLPFLPQERAAEGEDEEEGAAGGAAADGEEAKGVLEKYSGVKVSHHPYY